MTKPMPPAKARKPLAAPMRGSGRSCTDLGMAFCFCYGSRADGVSFLDKTNHHESYRSARLCGQGGGQRSVLPGMGLAVSEKKEYDAPRRYRTPIFCGAYVSRVRYQSGRYS